MKKIHLLVLTLSVSMFYGTVNATTIQRDPCFSSHSCPYPYYTYGSAGLEAGELQSLPLNGSTLHTGKISDHGAQAAVGYSVSFQAMHMLVQADSGPCDSSSEASCELGLGPWPQEPGSRTYYFQSEASASGFVQDFIYAPSAPPGAKLQIDYYYDATGRVGPNIPYEFSASTNEYAFTVGGIDGFYNVCAPGRNGPEQSQINGGLSGYCYAYIPLVSNHSAPFYWSLSVDAAALDASADLNAFETAGIRSITLLDANGNPLPNVPLYDGSGVNYNAVTTATPEPSAFLLASAGLLAVAVLRQRKTAGIGVLSRYLQNRTYRGFSEVLGGKRITGGRL